jgi:hypothetical protein
MNEELSLLVEASPNFRFLAGPQLLLAGDAALAERYVDSDPDGAMFKARLFGETMAKMLIRQAGITMKNEDPQFKRITLLAERGVIPSNIASLFHVLRKEGNSAVHGHVGDRQGARRLVETCHQLAKWWYKQQTGEALDLPFQHPRYEQNVSFREQLEKVEQQLKVLQDSFDRDPRPEPRIVIDPAPPDPHHWDGGMTVICGPSSYLVHDPVETISAADRSWKLMQAYAHSLDSHAAPVWLRGLLVEAGARRAGRDRAAEMVAGLGAQASFLASARGWNRSGATSSLHREGSLHILVFPRRAGLSWTETFGPGGDSLDPLVLPRALDALAAVAETLADLHRSGQAHRALDGDSILVPRTGGPGALRDLGLAWWPWLTRAGHRYPAPEQQAVARGRSGPATDVFQLAALLQHVCTGFQPAASTSIPLRSLLTAFPERLDERLRRALDPNPSNRPSMATLAAELRLGKRQLVTEASA